MWYHLHLKATLFHNYTIEQRQGMSSLKLLRWQITNKQHWSNHYLSRYISCNMCMIGTMSTLFIGWLCTIVDSSIVTWCYVRNNVNCIHGVIVYILDSSSDMISCEELICHASVFMVWLCTYLTQVVTCIMWGTMSYQWIHSGHARLLTHYSNIIASWHAHLSESLDLAV